MFRVFRKLKVSFPNVRRITSTFADLPSREQEDLEAHAAQWIERLQECKSDDDVQELLDRMGL